MEFIIVSSYLFLIFLSIQIWYLWKDIDEKKLKLKTINKSFFRKNYIYVFAFSVFFMIHEILEGAYLPYAPVFFELFEMLGFVTMAFYSYDWYTVLKTCTNKKSLPIELTDFASIKV